MAFDSSTIFVLPNGARRSPDVAWVKLEHWNALTPEEQDGFPPIAPDFVIELVSPSDLKKQTDSSRAGTEFSVLGAGTCVPHRKHRPFGRHRVLSYEDLTEKMQEYINNEVRLGWLVEPKAQKVEIYRPEQAVEILESPKTLSGEDVLPGFVLDLEPIWS